MDVAIMGVDLAKNVSQLHGVSRRGKVVLKRRMSRERLMEHIGQLPPCLIGIEACAGAFYWQRRFSEHGHTVKIISPQYVKPFVCRRQKNDGNDAEAICTAVQQPRTRFVPPKSIEQQDVQTLHRARQRLVNHRTALVSQMRGILLDRGIVFGVNITRARTMIPRILHDPTNALTPIARETIAELWDLFQDLDDRIGRFDDEIQRVFRASEPCQRIAKIKGVGPKTATAIVAAIGNGAELKNGRHLAAWLGLVPRQHSSGDRHLMLGITKRGDMHLRTLLVHGARAVCGPRRTSTTPSVGSPTKSAPAGASIAPPSRWPTRTHGSSGPGCAQENPIGMQPDHAHAVARTPEWHYRSDQRVRNLIIIAAREAGQL